MAKLSRKSVKNKAQTYDLWDEGGTAPTNGVKKSAKGKGYVPSILPAVNVAASGASYNPSADSYLKYANEVAAEENVEAKREDRAARKLRLRPGEKYATQEEVMGFLDSDEEDEKPDVKPDTDDEESKELTDSRPRAKPKTLKQRRKAFEQKEAELLKLKDKRSRKQNAELLRVRSLLKQVNVELASRQAKAVETRRAKVVKRLTGRKSLGHGKFVDLPEPVLLPNEIGGSLRALRASGVSVLGERVKSLEKRNILPIKSQKPVNQLKSSLKFKVVNKRETQEFLDEEHRKLAKRQKGPPKKK